jgi:hypothetical protein
MRNVDWFNPFKHAPGSIGALYCVFANLPREERYKRENILLLALIEGEPKHNLNSVLKPIVDELLTLWNGHRFWINLKYTLVRVALLCIACDIPATRKVACFMNHPAILGCSRCLKRFPVRRLENDPTILDLKEILGLNGTLINIVRTHLKHLKLRQRANGKKWNGRVVVVIRNYCVYHITMASDL